MRGRFLQNFVAFSECLNINTRTVGAGRGFNDFGRSVNPISTRGTDYAHLITTGTPGFSDLPTALLLSYVVLVKIFRKILWPSQNIATLLRPKPTQFPG